MNKIKSISLGLMATAALFSTSCGKDDHIHEPAATAIITITTPTEGQEIDHPLW